LTYEELMQHAIDICREGLRANQSPFGAVIADADGRIVAREHNRVRADHDPTAHAEINAIRAAGRKLRAHHLSGCILATTCEPCPMCAAAIHWARIDTVVYGASIADAARADFNELSVSCEGLYRSGGSPVRIVPGIQRAECAGLFEEWRSGPDPLAY